MQKYFSVILNHRNGYGEANNNTEDMGLDNVTVLYNSRISV